MNFPELGLAREYRSSTHQLGPDVFGQILGSATTYSRAVGFFSSSVFSVATREWRRFFSGENTMRLVCSPRLSFQDLTALADAIFDRSRWRKIPWEDLPQSWSGKFRAMDFLSWLLVHGKLRIKIAVRPSLQNAIYHEKIAIFTDQVGNHLCLTGSANETQAAWIDHFERVDLSCCWESPEERKRTDSICRAFEDLWQNLTPGIEVVSLLEAFRRELFVVEPEPAEAVQQLEIPFTRVRHRFAQEVLVPPADVTLFPHQVSAMQAWGKNQGRGILQMATGAGKTITALSIASRLNDAIGSGLAVLIVAPLLHLVDQWMEVAHRFGLLPIRCAESSSDWTTPLGVAIDALNGGGRPLLSIATTVTTLGLPAFQERLRLIRRPLLLIADEAHNLGSRKALRSLPYNAQYRLALSATPDRWHDEEGTNALREYFGDVVYRYDLKDAIHDEILTPYFYHPILVPFSEDEFETYVELTKQIGRYLASGTDETELGEAAQSLLIKRARLIASARAKVPALREQLVRRRRDSQILVYCGDGSFASDEGAEFERQIDAVLETVGGELQMLTASFTAKTNPQLRQERLADFAQGRLQVLVAIRCLDEGVDIPSVRTAFLLASSTNPRQFIQRRGRVLRRFPGKDHAAIFDFIVTPPIGLAAETLEWRDVAKKLIQNQMKRVAEFAGLAENAPFARGVLHDILNRYHILDAWEAS